MKNIYSAVPVLTLVQYNGEAGRPDGMSFPCTCNSAF